MVFLWTLILIRHGFLKESFIRNKFKMALLANIRRCGYYQYTLGNGEEDI